MISGRIFIYFVFLKLQNKIMFVDFDFLFFFALSFFLDVLVF